MTEESTSPAAGVKKSPRKRIKKEYKDCLTDSLISIGMVAQKLNAEKDIQSSPPHLEREVTEDEMFVRSLLPSEFIHEFETFESGEQLDVFKAKIRCNLYSAIDAQRWFEEFSEKSCTRWIVHHTYPNTGGKLIFRKSYICQHANRNKSMPSPTKKNSRCRGWDCNASLNIRIHKDTQWAMRRDTTGFIKKGLIGAIELNFDHSKHKHAVGTPESFSYFRMKMETKEMFIEYFRQGYAVLDAIEAHKNHLSSKYGTDMIEDVLANASENPRQRTIRALYDSWKAKEFGSANIIRTYRPRKRKVQEEENIEDEEPIVDVVTMDEPYMEEIVENTQEDSREDQSKEICLETTIQNVCLLLRQKANQFGPSSLKNLRHFQRNLSSCQNRSDWDDFLQSKSTKKRKRVKSVQYEISDPTFLSFK